MEDVLGFMLFWLVTDIIFWGMCYPAGCLLTPLISLGKWRAAGISWVKTENGRKRVKHDGFTLKKDAGQVYLGAFAVALLGLLFWVLAIVILVLYFNAAISS